MTDPYGEPFFNYKESTEKWNREIQAINKKINVIISAYKADKFIEECLDSISIQTYKAHKILLGIDSCEDTLKIINKIQLKYKNLQVYYSKKNNGPYQMFNSLIKLVPDDEYILIFGADDIMNINMLETMSQQDRPAVSYHDGILFIKKQILDKVGGYRDWVCGADSDILYRLKLALNYDIVHCPKLFFYRSHDEQLTKKNYTDLKSELRKKYIEIMETNKVSDNPDIFIKPVCSEIIKIF